MYPYPKRKKFPSQIKYEQNNPTITFRMKKHEKELIQGMADNSGKSISELIRVALLNLEKDFSEVYDDSDNKGYNRGFNEGQIEGYENGHDQGYKKGKSDWVIWVYCYNCWKPLFIKPDSEDHKILIDTMKGWLSHSKCP